MQRWSMALLVLTAAGGCGARSDKAVTQFNLSSPAFRSGQPIPAQYTCDGAGTSPALEWSDPPAGTRSLALVVDDPDAPRGTFRHWGAYDIPPTTRSIGAGQVIGVQAINDAGQPGYKGPCPPPGNGPHHYRFKLYALDVDQFGGAADPKIEDVESAARKHILGLAQLTGIYERK